MNTHAYHPGLEGYRESDVFHDGCPVCEGRVVDLRTLLSYTDPENIARLWRKMVIWHKGEGQLPISAADAAAWNLLRDVALFIAKYGHDNPWLEDYLSEEQPA